jgi:hypothetical protein
MNVMTKALGATVFLCLLGLLSGPAADANGATRADDIVGWWQMGEGATESGGTWTVPDDSVNSNPATGTPALASGITLVPGAIGGVAGTALSFDGSIGSALSVDGTTTLANIGAGSFSVSLWMKADQTSLIADGNWHRLVTKEESGVARWTVENEFSNSRFAWFTTGSGYNYTNIDDFDASEWRHLAFVRDTATEQLLTYDNGVTISTHGGPGAGVSVANGGDLGIAGLPNGEAPTTTILDDVRIYDVALSSADVSAIYNGGAGDLVSGPPPTSFEWTRDDLGDWNSPANWTPGGGGPNDKDHTATFGTMASVPTTVVTNTPVTVNTIEFDNTNTYVVAGTGKLILEADGDGGLPSIAVSQGTHEIQVQASLNSNTDVDVMSGATLEFNNQFNLNGKTLNKTGDGTLNINNQLISGGGTVVGLAGTLGGSGVVQGDVNNLGSAMSPGNSPGMLTVDGNYNQASGGTLAIEIGGTQPGVEHDVLNVLGEASLAGTLSVSLIDGFTPGGGDTFKVLTAAGELTDLGLTLGGPAAGSFTMSVDTTNDWIMLMTAGGGGGLSGDYNGNSVVDAADYTIFRDNLGGNSSVLSGNGSGAATVVQADYDLWKQNFGSSGAGSSAAVPEPCSLLLLAMGLSGAAFVVLRRG